MATDIIMAERPTFGDHKSRGCLFCSVTPFPPPIQTNTPFYQYSGQLLSLLELRSIMGCPKGTRSVLTRAFWQKENFTVHFLGKRRLLLHPTRHNDLFFAITIFFWENLKKNWPVKRA